MKAILITLTLLCVHFDNAISAETKKIYYLDKDLDGEDLSFNTAKVVNSKGVLEIGDFNGHYYHSFIKWDMASLPDNASEVQLLLYKLPNKPGFSAPEFSWLHMNKYWDDDYGPDDAFSAGLIATLPPPKANSGWIRWNITRMYLDWKDGVHPNYGFGFGPAGQFNKGLTFAGMEFRSKGMRPRIFVVTRDFKLAFPIKGLSPFTTRCTAVFDNDRSKNKKVKAYNGAIADGVAVPFGGIIGYKKKDGSNFDLPFLNYDDEVGAAGTNDTLFYDNHTGYDYAHVGKVVSGTEICAAASGVLVAATSQTTKNDGVWREKKIAVPGAPTTLQWEANHAFCIKHEQNYSTWYVHASDFTPTVKQAIAAKGYARVSKGDPVAYVGDKGAEGHPHLHFGVRKRATLIDPYGNGTSVPFLWQVSSPLE